jgi:microcystin-dependent protein
MTSRGIGGAALGCLIAIASAVPAHAFSDEDYLSSIGLFGGNFCPKGTLHAAGQNLPINQNQALFSLLGLTYGGDGQTTFALPDLRGKEPAAGSVYCVIVQGIFPSQN